MKVVRFEHPGQPNMFVEVVKASRSKSSGRKVYTLHLRYPRIIHGEMMTHRVFNRNARSSRAVPVMTLLEEIRTDPFIPWHWTKAQKGMQGADGHDAKITMLGSAAQFVDADLPIDNVSAWLHVRDVVCDAAESFAKADYHKQVANRLVEPFMWMDLLVTATHWANFLHLRDHPDAEPHIRDLAVLVGKALAAAKLKDLDVGEWHLPYIEKADRKEAQARFKLKENQIDFLKKISAARCARISYKPFDGDASYERELERFEMLIGNDAVHASPLEHQCSPDQVATVETTWWNDEDNAMLRDLNKPGFLQPELHGPLTGFIQHRKLVSNEAVHD